MTLAYEFSPMSKRQIRKARSRRRAAEKGAQRRLSSGLLPQQATRETPSATPTRRVDGLSWLYPPKGAKRERRISEEQHSVGRRYGEICSEAARAALPGKSGLEGSGSFGSRTPSEAAFQAIRAEAEADARLRQPFAPELGEALVKLMKDVCHHGQTLRDLAAGDRYQALILEERLKMGLSILRYLVNSGAARRFVLAHRTERV